MIQNLNLEHIIQIFTNLLVEKPVSDDPLNPIGDYCGQQT